MKTCSHCKRDLEGSEFYTPTNSLCKVCAKESRRKSYQKHKEKEAMSGKVYYVLNKDTISAKQKEYKKAHTQEINKYAKEWREINQDRIKEYSKRAQAKYRSDPKNLLKHKARAYISSVVRRGKLIPGPCAFCGDNERTEAHHPDYNEKDKIIWMCKSCHRTLDTLTNRQAG
jgi:hypothetical protein